MRKCKLKILENMTEGRFLPDQEMRLSRDDTGRTAYIDVLQYNPNEDGPECVQTYICFAMSRAGLVAVAQEILRYATYIMEPYPLSASEKISAESIKNAIYTLLSIPGEEPPDYDMED